MGFLKDGSFATSFIDQNPIEETEVLMDSRTNKPTGYVQNVSYNIVDVGRMAADPAYLADIKSQYQSVFLDPKTDYSLKQQYLTDIGYSAHTWEELSGMDPGFAEREVKDAMIEHQWEGYFPKQFGEKVALTQIELKKGSALLTQAEQFNNPIGGQPYVAGDTVYVTRAAKERFKDPDAKEGNDNIDTYAAFLKLSNTDLIAELKTVGLTVANRGRFGVNQKGNIVVWEGDDATKFKEITPEVFRAILAKASSTERNK